MTAMSTILLSLNCGSSVASSGGCVETCGPICFLPSHFDLTSLMSDSATVLGFGSGSHPALESGFGFLLYSTVSNFSLSFCFRLR